MWNNLLHHAIGFSLSKKSAVHKTLHTDSFWEDMKLPLHFLNIKILQKDEIIHCDMNLLIQRLEKLVVFIYSSKSICPFLLNFVYRIVGWIFRKCLICAYFEDQKWWNVRKKFGVLW